MLNNVISNKKSLISTVHIAQNPVSNTILSVIFGNQPNVSVKSSSSILYRFYTNKNERIDSKEAECVLWNEVNFYKILK